MHWIANEYAYRRSDLNRCRAATGQSPSRCDGSSRYDARTNNQQA